MASCAVACSSLLAFDDLKSAPSDGGAAGGADAAVDAPGTSSSGAHGSPGSPTGVIAGSTLVTTLAGSGQGTFNAPVGIALDAFTNGNV